MRSLSAAKEVIGSGAGVGYCCARSLSVDSATGLASDGGIIEPIADLSIARIVLLSGGFNEYEVDCLRKEMSRGG